MVVANLEMTDDRQPDHYEQPADDPYFSAAARLRFCDERGIDIQFLNPTFLVGPFVQAAYAFDLRVVSMVNHLVR